MKNVIVAGIPDKYLLEIITSFENNAQCKKLEKKYTSFQFFNDYKIGDIDIIVLDGSIPDKDILQMAKEIRELDNKPIIVGCSLRTNPILENKFKAISKCNFIVKSEDVSAIITELLETKSSISGSGDSDKNTDNSDKTILVIDDFENTLNIVQYSLEQAGFNVVTALSGREALRKIQANMVPSIIVTDLNMPKMDGFELIENIRKFDHLKSVPIFILTTEFSVTKKIKAKSLNITGWIQKPYDINEFINIVSNAI